MGRRQCGVSPIQAFGAGGTAGARSADEMLILRATFNVSCDNEAFFISPSVVMTQAPSVCQLREPKHIMGQTPCSPVRVGLMLGLVFARGKIKARLVKSPCLGLSPQFLPRQLQSLVKQPLRRP